MRKAQGSIEYLIILAVVIVVALVVIGVMGWFPGLGGDIKEKESMSYWSSAQPLAIKETKVPHGTSITVQLRVQNMMDRSMTITDVDLGGKGSIASTLIGGGQEKTINITSVNPGCSETGDMYELDVIITYDTVGITDNKQIGDQPIIGKCV